MIRPAGQHEALVVRDLVRAAYQHYVAVIGMEPGPMADDYTARIAADQVWVLEHAGEVVGVLVLEDRPEGFLLDNIAVRPDRQGGGYGRAMLDFAEVEAARLGRNSITLYTHIKMVDNIRIYAARGYVEQERRTEKGFDRVYMVKSLA